MNVVVYTTPTCPYCNQVKQFLAQRGVTFTERDVSVDRAAAMEMIQKTGQQGVPVTIINDQAVVGFDRPRLEQLLAGQGNGRRASLGVQAADASKFAQKHGAIPVFGALVGGVNHALSALSPGSRVAIVFLRGQSEFRAEIVL
jgi:glutaredoxin-like YruB-family protein